MNRTPLALITTIALAWGCANDADKDSVNGVYMLVIDSADQSGTTDDVEHDFVDALTIGAPGVGDWTDSTDAFASSQVLFAEIFDTDEEGAKGLVVGDRAYLGTKKDGSWSFEWTNSEAEDYTENHESGYFFSASQSLELYTSIVLALGERIGEGALYGTSTAELSYEEPDEWDAPAVGRFDGEIPSDSYLVYVDGRPVRNDWETQDCAALTCVLTVTESVTFSSTVEYRLTDLDPDAFDGVSASGQPYGLD